MKIQKLLCLLLFAALFNSGTLYAQCGLYPIFTETLNNQIPTFTNNSTVVRADGWHIISYTWNFGDGSGSDLQSPTHVYTDTGTYNVCLVLLGADTINPDNLCYDTTCHEIHIGILPICGTAAFVGQVGGSRIYCTNTSTGTDSITNYYWKVYNGSSLIQEGTSQQSFITDSLAAGNYSVCLYLNHNEGLCDSSCQQFTINSSSCSGLSAAWTVTSSYDTAHFTQVDNSLTDSYSWTFIQDFPGSTAPNPVYNFGQAGTYNVCLIASRPGTSCTDTFCQNVIITDPCTMNFNANWTYRIANDSIYFIPADTIKGVQYFWVLPAAQNLFTVEYPVVPVPANGAYNAYLVTSYSSAPTIYGIPECSDSIAQYIIIGPPCDGSSFTYTVNANNQISATGSGGNVTTPNSIYTWTLTGASGTILNQSNSSNTLESQALANGTYKLCLSIRNGTNYCDTFCQYISINDTCDALNANWSVISNAGYGLVYFAATDTASNVHHIWNFGDGTTSTTNTSYTSHTYTLNGTYHVCLTTYIPGSSCPADSVCQNVTLPYFCPAGFTGNWTSTNTTGNTVNFTALDTSSGATNGWSFGDGTSATGKNPSHTYAQAGTYNVCHGIYTSSSGELCVDTVCQNITVGSNSCWSINGAFTYSQTTGTDTIHFTSVSDSTDWYSTYSFGDGTGSTTFNPTHYYAQPGTYTVCRYIAYKNYTCYDTVCQTVVVANPCGTLTAQWESYTITGNEVRFYSYDTNTAAHHIFNFGDGTSVSASDTTHTYASAGTYHVCFYVYIPGTSCSDSLCENITVGSTSCWSINGAFTYTQGAPYDTIYFTSESDSTDWYSTWNFGDGNTTTGFNPAHFYLQSGTYNVCRYIAYKNNTCHDTVCQSVTVRNYCSGIDPGWTYGAAGANTVSFNAVDTVAAIHRDWNFGDGNYGFGVNVSHTYTAAGSYHVCLITYVPGECTDSFCTTITISSNTCYGINGAFTYTQSAGTDTIHFASVADSTSWLSVWNFGDGSANSTEPYHLYAQAGTYTVCRAITYNNKLCHDTICQSITVSSNCPTLNAYWLDSLVSGSTYRFYAFDTNKTAHHIFNFGDGTSANSTDTTHTYATAGTYTACLYVYLPGSSCPTDSLCRTITVTGANCYHINGAFTYSQSAGTDTIHFASEADSTNWLSVWNFGDGSISTEPYHLYTQAGTYTVCRAITYNNKLCHDTICQSITVSSNCPTLNAYWLDSLVSGSTYRFYAFDTNKTAHHIFNFGDGTYANSTDTTHNYAANGTYTACLYVYLPGSSCPTDSLCRTITVTGANCYHINGAFTYTQSSGTDTIHFTSAADSTAWLSVWNFGDGSISTEPYHLYAQAGTYTVCRAITYNNKLCHDTICQSVTVTSNCPPLNAYWLDSLVSGSTYRFYAFDTNTAAHHIFNFGDGTYANSTDTTHTYTAAGTFTACLYVYLPGSSCPTDSLCRTITVGSTCGTASLYGYTRENQIHAFSSSTGTNSNTLYTWKIWSSTGKLVEDTTTTEYAFYSDALANGTYNLCLLLYNGTSFCDSACESFVVNNPCSYLNAAFTWTQQTNTTDSIEFHSTVDSSTWTYLWIFGDNTSSTEPDVIHHYAQPGTYTVCHIVTYTSLGCDDTICQSVTVAGTPSCGTAQFSYYIYGTNSIHAYSTATNVPTGTIYTWYLWNANGVLIQSQSNDTSYIRSQQLGNGTYRLCLFLYTANNLFCDSVCQSITIDSSNICSGLSAYYYPNTEGNGSILFTPSDTSAAHTHYWVFGDGTTSTAVSPTHAYANGGVYQACLYISIPGTTCLDSFCRTITVSATQCNAGFTYIQSSNATNTIQFTSTSTSADSITEYRWTLGDGTVLYGKDVTHAYAQSGEYEVCLYIYTANGCTSSYCDSVKVAGNPCLGFTTAWTSTVLSNGNIQFHPTDTSTALHRYWTFGDGQSSTNFDPVHAYAQAGTYNVCLVAYIPGTACIDTTCATIVVGASGCSAGFTYQSYYPPYDAVRFTNTSTSSDSIISYYWTFGDNTSATFASGTHTYPHSGYWYVCLTITTLHGCTSTYCDTIFAQYDPCYGMSASWTYTYTNSGGVQFTSETTPAGAYNLWNFGDGTSSTEADPIHNYAQPGTYNVCHITGISGSCADTSCESIQGTSTGSTCHADFTYATDTLNNHAYFTNTSTSSDSIIRYYWSFGDDSTSTIKTPYHAYANAGTYYVCLSITSVSGCTSTYCDSVTVHVIQNSGCNASFTWVVDTCQLLSFTNTSTGGFTNQYWLFGDGSTADTSYDPTHLFPVGTWTVELTIYSSTGCQASHTATITVDACGNKGNDTVCGNVFDDSNGNGVQDQGEKGVAGAEVYIGSLVVYADSNGHYSAIVPAGNYTIYYCAPAGYTFTLPVSAVYNTSGGYSCAVYAGVEINSPGNCGFNFGIKINSITVCGTVYFDANDNHIQDPGESGIANAQVILIDSGDVVYTVFTDQYGHYCAVVPAGSYVITISSNAYPGAVISPASIALSNTSGGSNYDNNNFGVYVQPGTCDLSVSVTANTTVTPGYPAWYEVEVCNVGTNVTSGTVNMFYDPHLTFGYASPLPTSQNSSTFTISWTLTNLLPGSCQYYWVSTTADSGLAVNQPIFTLVSATTSDCTDANLNNNVDTLHQNVTASWDPNNKTVSPAGVGADGAINNVSSLNYTVNFQNTGTAPAVNIVIHDTLSANVDPKSFRMMGASAPYTVQITGNVVVWKFNDIMLPDSAMDQQGSHGFVSYSVNLLPNLPQGTQITNSATLFFDYNAGQTTNTTLNTIDYTLAISDISTTAATITLMPNPFSQYTLIRIEGAQAPYELRVFDLAGREVRRQTVEDNLVQFERNSLASGMYMYQIIQNGNILGQGKMIAE
jgi:PKD repeat protein